ncbi:hypothetical protein BV898_04087 [Hypsibius exemplaris]|uniref:Uncharacterized protein n=1 Tax=Hypsibius exemplaris TaxID=2072580 RepID=A0A1W0X324_HYPEX|nr:hypothetical protein BV898_04087 [Hypsibius exemplaris]
MPQLSLRTYPTAEEDFEGLGDDPFSLFDLRSHRSVVFLLPTGCDLATGEDQFHHNGRVAGDVKDQPQYREKEHDKLSRRRSLSDPQE